MTEENGFVHPQKTVNSILTQIAAVLEEADKVAKSGDEPETEGLRDALSALPPSDINEMSTHINAMYQACENMKVTQIAFRCDTDAKRIIAIIGIQFGIREIQLFAPFDTLGAKNMLKELVGSLELLESKSLILPSKVILEQ